MANSPKDLFLNFKEITVHSHASNSTTLVEESTDTGLTIRGGLLWLIHLVEFEIDFTPASAAHRAAAALSIVKGETTLPDYGDNGLIAKVSRLFSLATSGIGLLWEPKRCPYLPPIPIAAPNLSLYFKTDVDNAAFRAKPIHARVGYTTHPLDAKTYLEIAEAWGQGT